jgi:ribosomal protein L20
MNIFEISDQVLTKEDKLLLEQIIGYSYNNLINDLSKCNITVLKKVYSDEKIINDIELNKLLNYE